MKRILLRIFLTCLCAFLTSTAFAQWPTSASENLLICDHTGEQSVPKIAATSDGGCYIAWYDLSSGNYDVYLQRLNADGVPQWTNPCGILISNHPQETWITDWDIAVDLEDHCIIAVNDIRAGGDWDIYGYRISPAGEFVWGVDGIALSDNMNFEATPIVTVTSGGNIAFAWQEEVAGVMVVNLRKLSAAGADVYTAGTITLSSQYSVSDPRMAAGENDEMMLQYRVAQDSVWWAARHIYMQKYDSLGTELWPNIGAAVMTTNGIGIQMIPDLLNDGSGGAYSFWYDTRNNVHHVYVQHVNSAGAVEWAANGVQTDFSANELQMSPVLTRVEDGVVIIYQAKNPGQSQGGIQAQKLNSSGELQWGNNAVVLIPLVADAILNLAAFTQGGNPVVAYSQYAPGSQINTVVRAIQIDQSTGAMVWDPSPRDLCSVVSEKGRLNVCMNNLDQIIAAWPDSRIENGDIYAQNINPDGSLGPLAPLPPSIIITSPAQDTTVYTDSVVLIFDVGGFIPGIDGVVYITAYHDSVPPIGGFTTGLFYSMPLNEGESMIVADLRETPGDPPIPGAADTVYVTYIAPNLPPTSFVRLLPEDSVEASPFELSLVWSSSSDPEGETIEYIVDLRCDTYPWGVFTEDTITTDTTVQVTVLIPLKTLDEYHWVNWRIFATDGIDTIEADNGLGAFYLWIEDAADDLPDGIPVSFALHPAYPNPFNPVTSIQFDLPATSSVTLKVYDIAGREVSSLLDNSSMTAGVHVINFDGSAFASGVYFYQLNAGNFTSARKMMLLK